MWLTQNIDFKWIDVSQLNPNIDIWLLSFQKKTKWVLEWKNKPKNFPITKNKDWIDFHFRISEVKIDNETWNQMFEIFKYSNKWEESIWWLIFEKLQNNIFYISGFEIEDDYFQNMWLWREIIETFYKHIWKEWMSFLENRSNIKWLYEKYWWNKEKFIPELVSRKVFYYWNNTTDKKRELKSAVKKFYNIN